MSTWIQKARTSESTLFLVTNSTNSLFDDFKSFSQICDFSKFLFPNYDFTLSDFHLHMHVSVFDFGGNGKKNHFELLDLLSLTC